MQNNMDVRMAARMQGVPLWRLADRLGLSEPTLYRRLRKPLEPKEKQRFLQAIAEDAATQSQTRES